MIEALIYLGMLAAMLYLIYRCIIEEKKKISQLRRYWDIRIGMSEAEMLGIMGSGFNRSLLRNGVEKYEWRINAQSYGTSHRGRSVRYYTGVRKVDIYTKNGFVVEVRPYNV